MLNYFNNMTSIGYITKKIINNDNNVFSLNYDKSDPIKPLMKLVFSSLVNNVHKGKFIMFKESLISFLNFSREEFINLFCKIQKTYHSFSRLAFIYKYKKSSMSVTTDIGLNDITINDKNIVCIYHFNSRYLFNVNDLLKIITTSLTNSYLLFSQPLPSKNPYNNLPFTKSNLYNIYFFIKFNTKIYNDLFFKFFDCDFNLSSFYHKYEYLLREYIIGNFIKNSSVDVLIEEITKMLSFYNKKHKKKILIDDEFPKNKLIKIMKPYLLLYLQSYCSLIPLIKNNTSVILDNKLKQFQKFCPQFGRKIIKLGFKCTKKFKKKSYIKSVEFLDKHIPFNCNENANFLTNHTYYNEIDNNNEENNTESQYIITYAININDGDDDNNIIINDDDDDDVDDDDNDSAADNDDDDDEQHIENTIIYDVNDDINDINNDDDDEDEQHIENTIIYDVNDDNNDINDDNDNDNDIDDNDSVS